MVIGAGWAGARAFTPTAGPGISLMNEFIGLAYYAEVPAVIFDVQRTGPSTGMPTRTQQGDLMMCAYASHGDTRHICLYPADPREAFEMAAKAFDLAERFQTPVFVLSDLDIGMNDWMVPKLTWDDSLPARSRQGAVGRGAREGQELLPLSRRRRRRHPVPHRCRACIRRARTSRAARATTSSAATPRTPTSTRRCSIASRARSRTRRGPCRRRSCKTTPGAKIGLRHGRRLPRRVRRGDGSAGQGRHRARLHARARLPVRRRGAAVPRAARGDVRRRAEPRRAAAQPADARDRRAVEKMESVRYYAGFPMSAHHVISGVQGEAGEGGMTYIAKPKVHHPSLQEERDRADAPRLRRRDHDALRRLRPRLDHGRDHPGVLGARIAPHTWPSCRASAARRRRRRTSCARRTASTACTAGCRRWRPAPTPPTAS